MQGKKTLGTILILVVLIAALAGAYALTRPATTAGQKTFTLEVIHSDGSTKKLDYTTELEFVGEVLQADGIIEGTEGPYGLYIQIVDGEKAVYDEDDAYWSFLIGEEPALQGIDLTPIEDGASYKLVYTPAF